MAVRLGGAKLSSSCTEQTANELVHCDFHANMEQLVTSHPFSIFNTFDFLLIDSEKIVQI